MGHNDFDQDIQQSDGSPWPDCQEGEAVTTAMVRLRARLFAGRLDRELDAGAVPMPGSALAAHVARLTTIPYVYLAPFMVMIVLFGFTYVALYWRIVRFRSPRWMVFRR